MPLEPNPYASSEPPVGTPAPADTSARGPWYKLLNRYQWFVLVVAALGWLFDTMDQQLFALTRKPAMEELLSVRSAEGVVKPKPEDVTFYGSIATSVFMLGWATGGLVFGVLGDRLGRAKVMLWTILAYSLCTGLSAFSVGIWDFALYRFLTGLGVGGEFAVGVALVAEVMPDKARPYALGLLQALSTVGNVTAALLNMSLGFVEGQGGLESLKLGESPVTAWRVMFVIGTFPALLALLIRRNLKEPEQWQAMHNSTAVQKQLGSYAELFATPVLRRNAIVGLIMGFAGVVGLWGIGFWSFDLLSTAIRPRLIASGVESSALPGQVAFWVGLGSVFQNMGAFFGIYAFSYLCQWTSRRFAFLVAFLSAMASTAFVFAFMNDFSHIFWMLPLMGFCQLALFGGYAIYFPELFPTRLRSTGTSFCYNVGRFLAAAGPFALGYLSKYVFTPDNGFQQGFRWAAVSMSLIFILGVLVLPFAPETKDRPLPD